jgi:hypothetical protein
MKSYIINDATKKKFVLMLKKSEEHLIAPCLVFKIWDAWKCN